MADENKSDLRPVDVSAQSVTMEKTGSEPSSIIEKQTRTRRLFSATQLFAFNIVYLGTWYYTAGYVSNIKRT